MRRRSILHLRHGVVASLVLLLGALSAAPTLSRLTCHGSGRWSVQVGEAKDCCPEDEERADGPVYRAICCEVLKTEPRKDEYRPQDPNTGPSSEALDPPQVPTLELAHVQEEVGRLTARPPPLIGKARLVRHATFLL
ncbi:MAG: hypothetical protein JNM31_04190 [Flavobacteriales bacterium]|nr:hypothetical protein [Flavobacteriales bacterium]